MGQIMHLVVGSVLFSLTWRFVLKKTWPMEEKINEIGEKIDKFFE